jgi:uncharacterized protein
MARSHLQYEDIAAETDWRKVPAALERRLMAISADSHVTEPPEAFSRYIDPKYRDVAPRIARNPAPDMNGEVYLIKDLAPFVFNLAAAAGRAPKEMKYGEGGFADLHRGGWDPKARIADQERDGILAEVIYPTVGMILCGLDDRDYKHACMQAYNMWLRDYIAEAPTRLYGVGQSAVRSVKDAIADLHKMKELGFKSAMLPNMPSFELDYDHPDFDPLWEAAVELGLPISFHILTGRSGANSILARPPRGGKVAGFCSIIRECQDVIGLFVFGGIFRRHPELRIVCVEADAGWVPHFASRMDNAYKRHRFWMKVADMPKLPSEYIHDNVYFTFQDDWVALQTIDMVNAKHMLWANDFPHSDSTWPLSHKLLAHQMEGMTDEQVSWILRENVKELYRLDVDTVV